MAIWSVNPYFQIHPTIIVLIVYSHYHLKIGIIPIIMIYIYMYISHPYIPMKMGIVPIYISKQIPIMMAYQ